MAIHLRWCRQACDLLDRTFGARTIISSRIELSRRVVLVESETRSETIMLESGALFLRFEAHDLGWQILVSAAAWPVRRIVHQEDVTEWCLPEVRNALARPGNEALERAIALLARSLERQAA
jgi:hypothetical protein